LKVAARAKTPLPNGMQISVTIISLFNIDFLVTALLSGMIFIVIYTEDIGSH